MEIINPDQAFHLIYQEKIVKLDDLVNRLIQEKDVLKRIKKFNPDIIDENGKLKNFQMDKERNGKRRIICLGHETGSNNSTNILLSSNTINCFTGGCLFADGGMNIVQFYAVYKLGADPEVIKTDKAKGIRFRAMCEILEKEGYKVQQNSRRRMSKEEKDKWLNKKILEKATNIYHQEFIKSEKAQKYFLETRGFKYSVIEPWEYLIKRFKIGCAPEEFPSTFLYDLLSKEYTTDELLKSSVVKWMEFKDDNGKVKETRALDFHSDGLIIPYWNKSKVSNLYSRGFNAPKSWRHLRLAGSVDVPINFDEGTEYETVNISEGELSWATLIALGYPNSLGNRGTNGLSDEHIKMLKTIREESEGRYCKTITIIFDADGPGIKATLKTGTKLLEEGFDVRVVILPKGMDPNDILVEYKDKAKTVFDKLYGEAVSFYTFVALTTISEDATTEAEKIAQLNKVKQEIANYGITDGAELYLIANEFATKHELPVDLVWREWKKDNKNIEAFSKQNYVFVTNDLEGFYLTKSAFEEKTTYVEDVEFNFINDEVSINNMIVDEDNYKEEEMKKIEAFCNNHHVRFLPIRNFKGIFKMDNQSFTNALFKN